MNRRILIGLIGMIFTLMQFQCSSVETKETDPDDVLEEELRADPEPFKDVKNREIKDDSSKNTKKPLKR
jgi:hypothetical protein